MFEANLRDSVLGHVNGGSRGYCRIFLSANAASRGRENESHFRQIYTSIEDDWIKSQITGEAFEQQSPGSRGISGKSSRFVCFRMTYACMGGRHRSRGQFSLI